MSVPALYTHTTRSAGSVLTASIYNDDHTNHIANGTPAMLGSYSESNAEMQSTTNPFPGASESLATSLAGELERLRYQVALWGKYLNGNTALTQWYYTIANPRLVQIGCSLTATAAVSIPNNAYTAVAFNAERFDSDAFHSTTSDTTRITIPAGLAGKYLVWGTVAFAANAAGDRGIEIAKTVSGPTTTVEARWDTIAVAASVENAVCLLNIQKVINLAATDYVELRVFQDSGGALDVTQANNYTPEFGATFLGV